MVFDLEQHAHHLPELVALHRACVERGRALASFLPPLDEQELLAFWTEYATSPKTSIIMQLVDGRVVGTVVLKDVGVQTGPFRAQVLKLLVLPEMQRRGIATRVMRKLESVADAKGLTMLYLDTPRDSAGDYLYPTLGYTRIGVLPQYGISPDGGPLIDEVFYYKLLPGHEERWTPKR